MYSHYSLCSRLEQPLVLSLDAPFSATSLQPRPRTPRRRLENNKIPNDSSEVDDDDEGSASFSQPEQQRTPQSTTTSCSSASDTLQRQRQQPLLFRRFHSDLPNTPPPSLSSSVVDSLFPGLGPCWGEYPCTYRRIPGRLYATSHALVYHRYLLGGAWDRRICLWLDQIKTLELYRTTSIRVVTTWGDTYIFKSFDDREVVWHTLRGLQLLSLASKQNGGNDPNLLSASWSTHAPLLARDQSTASAALPSRTATIPTTIPRPRAMSESSVRSHHESSLITPLSSSSFLASSSLSLSNAAGTSGVPNESSSLANLDPSVSGTETPTTSVHSSSDYPDADSESNDLDRSSSATALAACPKNWVPTSVPLEELKRTNHDLQQVGVSSLVLPCSLDAYYNKFLADGARHSVDYYQQTFVRDVDVELTKWELQSDGSCHRILSFTHPLRNSLGLGPTAARTTRFQRLRRWNTQGRSAVTLENRTFVEGIPGADSFSVQDLWILQEAGANNNNKLELSIHFDVRFHKRCLFKNIIQKSVRKETQDWIAGYIGMVQDVLGPTDQAKPPSSSCNVHNKTTTVPTTESLLGTRTTPNNDRDQTLARLQQLQRGTLVLLLVVLVVVFLQFRQIMSLEARVEWLVHHMEQRNQALC